MEEGVEKEERKRGGGEEEEGGERRRREKYKNASGQYHFTTPPHAISCLGA